MAACDCEKFSRRWLPVLRPQPSRPGPIIPAASGRILAAGIPHATLHVYHGGHVELVTRRACSRP